MALGTKLDDSTMSSHMANLQLHVSSWLRLLPHTRDSQWSLLSAGKRLTGSSLSDDREKRVLGWPFFDHQGRVELPG